MSAGPPPVRPSEPGMGRIVAVALRREAEERIAAGERLRDGTWTPRKGGGARLMGAISGAWRTLEILAFWLCIALLGAGLFGLAALLA